MNANVRNYEAELAAQHQNAQERQVARLSQDVEVTTVKSL